MNDNQTPPTDPPQDKPKKATLDQDTLDAIFAADLANVVKKCKAGKPLSKEDKRVLLAAAGQDPNVKRNPDGTFTDGNQNAKYDGHGGIRGKPKWTPKYTRMAREMAKHRMVEEEIAETLGIHIVTLNRWKKKHPPFAQALKAGKESADKQVERALFERAVGYSHPDTDVRTISRGNGQSEIVLTPIIKHYPPDTTACIYWTKNRQPQKWRDRTDTAIQNPDGTAITSAPVQVHLILPAGRAEGIMQCERIEAVPVTVEPAPAQVPPQEPPKP